MKVGEELLVVNTTQKVTVISETAGVIMLLFHGSGEPFVVTDSYEIEDGKIRWFGSRYRKDIG